MGYWKGLHSYHIKICCVDNDYRPMYEACNDAPWKWKFSTIGKNFLGSAREPRNLFIVFAIKICVLVKEKYFASSVEEPNQ